MSWYTYVIFWFVLRFLFCVSLLFKSFFFSLVYITVLNGKCLSFKKLILITTLDQICEWLGQLKLPQARKMQNCSLLCIKALQVFPYWPVKNVSLYLFGARTFLWRLHVCSIMGYEYLLTTQLKNKKLRLKKINVRT